MTGYYKLLPFTQLQTVAVHRSEAETLDMENARVSLLGKGPSAARLPFRLLGNTGARLHVKGGHGVNGISSIITVNALYI